MIKPDWSKISHFWSDNQRSTAQIQDDTLFVSSDVGRTRKCVSVPVNVLIDLLEQAGYSVEKK